MNTRRHPNLIGLSLSLCIGDVVEGRVSVEQIDRIIAGTKAETPEQWEEVITEYRTRYWEADPDRAERIVRTLLRLGKIEQPRVTGVPLPNRPSYPWMLPE